MTTTPMAMIITLLPVRRALVSAKVRPVANWNRNMAGSEYQ